MEMQKQLFYNQSMKLKSNLLIFAAIAALIFVTGCPTTKVKEEVMDNTIVLEGNMTTGYEWAYEIKDESMISIEHTTKYLGEENVVGAGELNFFKLIPLAQGKTEIKFWYSRSWESIPPAVELWYEVNVSQNESEAFTVNYKEITKSDK